jgi:hypothetical protein
MLRPLFSYALTSLILLAQVGVPLHFHYCKGALESVSILFRNTCEDEKVPANMPDCCKKYFQKHCRKANNGCCHDQVKVVSQDLTSLMPGFLHWSVVVNEYQDQPDTHIAVAIPSISPVCESGVESNTGPPIYIRFHSLIYYA